jgi:molybdopterin-containing oxidoreductase family membrane subunit
MQTAADGGSTLDPSELLAAQADDQSIAAKISGIVLAPRFPPVLLGAFALSLLLCLLLVAAITYLLIKGIGIWGVNIPVAWGFAITNFVWWIGIGHAGTLISAVLLLLRQPWRASINRFAEAMTLFAVACAGLFPLLHLGRPYVFYWLLPYPDTMGLWPQWRSPLVWDAFAITTYFLVSLVFWYIGLLPDLATLRDRASGLWLQRVYGVLALGWNGSARAFQHYESSYLILAGIATPLVVSVHSIVSLDFSSGLVPGWHSTVFPPYFVAGAIFSGFAMVLMLLLPVRALFGLHDLVTTRHLDAMSWVMLVSGLIVGYGYVVEGFDAWFGANPNEMFVFGHRYTGDFAPFGLTMLACNVVIPQILWFAPFRRSPPVLFAICCAINVGMWLERFVIVVSSLERDFLPAAWSDYHPTIWDWSTYLGTIGLFLALMFLFIRALPALSISELRALAFARQTRAGRR